MCRLLKVSRSSYYKSLKQIESRRSIENKRLKEKILKIYNDNKKRYGAPKIHKILTNQGESISLKRVQRFMNDLGIKSIVCKKYKPHSSKAKVEERENILKRDFSTTTINEKWVTDITYIHTLGDGWCYLATVMDLHSRKIIGYAFDKVMDTDLAIRAVKNAYECQKPSKQVILHSDLGSQYTSSKFAEYISEIKFIHSFSS